MKRILFVCIENSCRSQMAEGFAKKLGAGKVEAYSAGSRPSGAVNPHAVAVMQEIGIDISAQKSNGFFDLPYQKFDYIITMGCKDSCPLYPSKETIDWEIEPPHGSDLDLFRRIRDEIQEKVKGFLNALKA
ncbi:MAG: arsenate reductase ArsC [Candidatus Margulisiibacteriota bacterium]|nr:arsenate reductase ArsC [Candidatus Margulisiibacteriota bacterium]